MIARRSSVVIDTNVLISALLFPGSQPEAAYIRALERFVVLATEETLNELTDVLSRKKFDRLIPEARRIEALKELAEAVKVLHSVPPVRLCRDPRDDKFLALALAGDARFLITGDDDLLVHNPFHGTSVITPADFLRL